MMQLQRPCSPQRVAWFMLALIASVMAMLAAGCSTPEAQRTNEFVTDFERMSGRDPLMSLLYLPEIGQLTRAGGVVIGRFQVGGPGVESDGDADPVEYADLFRVMLSDELVAIPEPDRFDAVWLGHPVELPPGRAERLLLVEGKVTVFDMGNGWVRYFAGLLFLGLGATDFQVEGRVTNYGTGELVMEFVDRRRHLANTPFGPNLKNLSDHTFAMKITELYSARSLAYLLSQPVEALALVDGDDTPEDAVDASEED